MSMKFLKSKAGKSLALATVAASSSPAFAAITQADADAQQAIILAGIGILGTLGVIVHLTVKSFKDGRKALG